MKRQSILALAMFFCATPVSAVIYNDGGTHVVDSNLGIDVAIWVDNESHLIFNEGGIARLISCQTGRVTMNGGWLHMGLSGYNNSRIDMYGGTTAVTFGGAVHLHNQAIARIFDGVVKDSFQAYDQSQAFIYGGELQSTLALNESEISISGGIINGDLVAREGSIIISGTGFNYDYGEISDLSGMLTGTLDNGDSINSWFYRQDNAGNGNYGTVMLVPELATLLLLDPNGGESLISGQTYTINWSSTDAILEVLIEYSSNNGQDWNPVIPPNIGNTGSYSWSVPAVTSQQCLVKISDSGDLGVNDMSDNVFEITELTLALIQPNGGEAILKGSAYDICWSSNLPAGNVLIEYSANNGQDWQGITTTEDTGSYEWQITGPQSNQYMVRVSDTNGWNVFDTSDSTFTVYTCQEQIAGDLNGDCVVNMVDFALVAQNWLEKGYVRISFSPLDTSPNWIMEGQWEFGAPTGNGGTENGNPDPSSGYTGSNVYGVNLNGDYSVAVGGPYCLTAGPFDCNKFHDMKLRFARWLNTDEPGYVESKIEVSNDGANWHTLWENTAAITDSNWQVVEYDVSGTADNEATVYFRWSYEILDDRAYPSSGWNIDDIELLGKF